MVVKGLKVFVSSIFMGYAKHMVRIGEFDRGERNIKRAYKWSPCEFTDLTIKMLEGIMKHKEKKYLDAQKIYLSVTESLRKSNYNYKYSGFEEELQAYEEVFGIIENKKDDAIMK